MEKNTKNRLLRLYCLLITIPILIGKVYCQNLVPNESFELYLNCPNSYIAEGEKIPLQNWHTPTKSTPDYFNSCAEINVNVPDNFMGQRMAADGDAYIGLLLAEQIESSDKSKKTKDYREYIQVKLIEPLRTDYFYIVKFYYSPADYSKFTISNIGIGISTKPLKGKYKYLDTADAIMVKYDTTIKNNMNNTWYLFCDTIKAVGREQYLTLGNFYSDDELLFNTRDFEHLRKSLKQSIEINGFAYYYFDMVSVTPILITNNN